MSAAVNDSVGLHPREALESESPGQTGGRGLRLRDLPVLPVPPPAPPPVNSIVGMTGASPEATQSETRQARADEFRMQALQRRDVAAQVDDRLRLLSTPAWWWLAAAGFLVFAFLGWAALTPGVAAVTGPARVVADAGVIPVLAPISGVVKEPAPTGTEVTAGESVFSVTGSGGARRVDAGDTGTVWQVLAQDGAFTRAEEPVLTLLPPDSATSALVMVPEEEIGAVAPGQDAVIGGGQTPNAVVAAVSPPLPVDVAAARTALTPIGPGQQILVTVELSQDMAPGTEVSAELIVSQVSVLGRIVGR